MPKGPRRKLGKKIERERERKGEEPKRERRRLSEVMFRWSR
jgi:hypothetical protein